MPTYSYLCDACGKSFEKEQRIVEDPIKICAHCGKPKARRQIVSGNFILKGGGWYSDGYGSKSSKSSTDKVEKSESTAKSDATPKSDATAKPESTPKTDPTPKADKAKSGETKAKGESKPQAAE
jgi:putative FmdB family regulatory protein